MTWVDFLHGLGLTNLSDEQVARFDAIRASASPAASGTDAPDELRAAIGGALLLAFGLIAMMVLNVVTAIERQKKRDPDHAAKGGLTDGMPLHDEVKALRDRIDALEKRVEELETVP
jgi:hypothetical protein